MAFSLSMGLAGLRLGGFAPNVVAGTLLVVCVVMLIHLHIVFSWMPLNQSQFSM